MFLEGLHEKGKGLAPHAETQLKGPKGRSQRAGFELQPGQRALRKRGCQDNAFWAGPTSGRSLSPRAERRDRALEAEPKARP